MSSRYSDEFRSVRCDSPNCKHEIEGDVGDRLSDLRRWGRKNGWERTKEATGYYIDLCPAHRISTRRRVTT